MSRDSQRGDMNKGKPHVFLDYGGLVVDYHFDRDITLIRAHHMARDHQEFFNKIWKIAKK